MTDLALIPYMVSMSITPGPNNIMLAASGVNFGVRHTVPHMLGISAGAAFQVVVLAAAMGQVMQWLDTVYPALVLAGCLYLLVLAWRQARAGQPGGRANARPLGFWAAAMFQWVNPKAWIMSVQTVILFAAKDGAWTSIVLLGLSVACINLPCIAVWAVGGDRLRSWLGDLRHLQQFNYAMAFLLAATAVWLLVQELFVSHGAGIPVGR